ncbi:hypothetical protein CHS0354_016676 [Potamilus streckersoni]|nr:hypothetical protein CHS0354_016676 [Potamilus streckersoni]
MYFESSQRSGGGDLEVVQIVDGVAYITFKEAEVARRVVSHNQHHLNDQTLTVTLFHPLPCYKNRVLIQGLNNVITEETLTNFLETKTEADVKEFLYGEEDGNVVVTLSVNIDIDQLREASEKKSIEGVFLQVARVTISNCIIVQNFQPSTSHDAIFFYFDNKKRSGGGEVERVEMKADEGCCLVYFKDHGVIDKVLHKSHKVDGADVEVHLHHECLGRRSSKNKSDPYLRISSQRNKELTTSRVHEECKAETTDATTAETGQLPNTSDENKDPADTNCIENSEVEIVQEPMREIQSRKLEELTNDGNTYSIEENDTEKDSLPASDDKKKKHEDEFPSIKIKVVDKICQVRYQIFKYFFTDLSVQVHFSEEEGCIYVQGESQETTDKITVDIQNAFIEMTKFQKSVVNITGEKYEHAKKLLEEINNHSSERKVYCYFFYPFNIHIVARTMDEVQTAKHKINLELGNIKVKDHHKKSRTINDSKDNGESSLVSSKRSSPDNTRLSFTTAEGIKVFVYRCSILQAEVDVIVNAANEDLKHGSGVAKAIADEAGKEFIEECKRYIREKGHLNIGSTCITSGGNLKYHFVIHTVGPQWDKYSKTSEGVQKCMDDLWKAVIGCFYKAETLEVQSIALPAVSSGKYGVPMEICASQYLCSVLKFSKYTQGSGSVKEIHFVDVNDKILNQIAHAFSATLGNDQAIAKEFSDRLQRVLSRFGYHSTLQMLKSIVSFEEMGHSSKHFESHYVLEENKSTFHFTKVFKVLVYTGDITDSTCQAIVSSEDKDLKSHGGVAKAIRKKAGQKFDSSLARHKGKPHMVGDVIEIDAGNLKSKKVLCCIIPKWTSSRSDEEYKRDLGQCFRSILEKAKAYKSVAMPLIGIGSKHISMELCGNILLECLLRFSTVHRVKEAIREVHIVCLDDGHIAHVKNIFTRFFDAQKKTFVDGKRNPMHLGANSSNTSGDQGQPPDKSHVQSKCVEQVNKSDELNEIRDEEDMDTTENVASYDPETNHPLKPQKMNEDEEDKNNVCAICLDTCDDPVKIKRCGHLFCKDCIDTQLQYKPVCPVCGTIYGVITGNQPKGQMTQQIDKHHDLEGYKGFGIIEITYHIPGGIQRDDHPKPGQLYSGLTRNAYLPNNEKGKKVFNLLHLAFKRRLIFTIGRSVTTGQDDMVTWNDIHHKTSMHGGPQRFGYPDPTYLDRVLEELAAKGVTEESENQDVQMCSVYERVGQ